MANKSQAIYANYLERSEKTKQALFMEVAERAEERTVEDAKDANAWYCMAYALGRYSQSISIAKALAQGLGGKVKTRSRRRSSSRPSTPTRTSRSAPSTPR